jgi:ligand-binding SRPBCC domain-containing protein
MTDDFRVRADLPDAEHAHRLARGLHEHEVEHDLAERLRHRLPVSASDTSVFVYAGDAQAAAHAAEIVRDVLADHELDGQVDIARWHPLEEAWEPVDVPLPATPQDAAAEHARVEAREAQESAAAGAQWEVRIDAASHRDAEAMADRLEADGLRPLRRWKHVFVSVATDDEARALADRLRAELPEAEAVIAEGTAADAWRATHPFAVLGGIAN